MDPQEREVIDGIFQRLTQAENNPRDPEAERYIAALVARQPYAPYALAQAVYVQEMAVEQLSERNQELEQRVRQLEEAAARAAAAPVNAPETNPPPSAGGFLSGLFGGGRASVPPTGALRQGAAPDGLSSRTQPGNPDASQSASRQPQQRFGGAQNSGPVQGGAFQGGAPQSGPWGRGPAQPQQAAGPWGGAPQQQPGQPGAAGGFLRGALTTAAGVAGGALLFDAVKGMMGGSSAANATPTDKAGDTAAKDASQTNAAQDNASAQPAADASQNDAGQDDASFQNAGYEEPYHDDQSWDDGGFDDSFGGGDDSWL